MADPLAPVRIVGWNAKHETWSAQFGDEPVLGWVQEIADAFMAAESRGVDLVVPAAIWAQWQADGDVPPWIPAGVRIEPQ